MKCYMNAGIPCFLKGTAGWICAVTTVWINCRLTGLKMIFGKHFHCRQQSNKCSEWSVVSCEWLLFTIHRSLSTIHYSPFTTHNMKGWLLTFGLIYLIAIEILRVYFIMPFPGSQQANTINIAYFIDQHIWWLRVAGFAITIIPLISILKNSKRWKKIVTVLVLMFYCFVFYEFNFKFLADTMFYQPKNKLLLQSSTDTTSRNKLIVGVAINNEAKAYPLEIIGYHHQVRDTIGGMPVMITYCTVCRTGRVYSPHINGKLQKFRL